MKKGAKIRTYVMHPAARVVDHRTGVEIRDVGAVLDGNLDVFIDAALFAGVQTPRPR